MAEQVAVSDGRGWSVGLDVGGTKIDGVLLDAVGLERGALRLPTRLGIDGVVQSGAEVVERLCAAADVPVGHLSGVGIGLPGLTEPSTGRVSHAVNLGIHGSGVPIGPLLTARLGGARVAVENDLNVAALGAARLLGLSGDLAFLALGTGVAAGLLLDGRLRRGHVGAAGEIGHVPYVPDGRPCPCGQRGCLELYASGAALDARWPSRSGRAAPLELFEAAAAGDDLAVEVRDTFVDAVAAAVRILVLTCDVEHVVLGGGVAAVGEPLRAAVAATLRAQAEASPFLRSLAIVERLGIIPQGALVAPVGAARAVRERAGDHLAPEVVR